MNQWILLSLVCLVWILWAVASLIQATLRNATLEQDQRREFSPVPVIPIFPLALWGIAILVDRFFAPWGTVVIGGLHAAFAATIVAYIVYCLPQLRAEK
jgi:type IV secretory pathway VirB6-like protein